MRFYKIDCPADNETEYLENIDCQINSQKDGSMVLTAMADIVQPINSVIITYMIIYRSMNKVMVNITFDYCKSHNNLPPFIRIIFDMYKKHSEDLIHECPYAPRKHLGVENLPLEVHSALLTVANFQRGDYKSVLEIRDKKKKLIMFANGLVTVSQKKPPKRG
jgi:hypothetical protein